MVTKMIDSHTVEIRCDDCGKLLEQVSVDDAFKYGCGYAQCYLCSQKEKIREELGMID